ncbi:Peptidoglycan/xylan/chitin deacetylase, PgdA/CDA1 family [Paenibacillus sp. 1_12]|uniref:polysaccharide deacetylase family protein n=1 Tax=Paenibacillus sp. 1_12 TaxID=1566278 RepID=UPI0008DEEABE|nr:polysaccharide deacetylase family protein [Paenibacillus sp. 1_12]SFK71435.1 Peptidoglycan/xylan/chitin deacetylase, PgdA/CDA1 family [Paenibacillus sp. 1_12]
MAVSIFKERKQQWIMGISFCSMVSMALINFTVTGSVLPLPEKHKMEQVEEASEARLKAPQPSVSNDQPKAADVQPAVSIAEPSPPIQSTLPANDQPLPTESKRPLPAIQQQPEIKPEPAAAAAPKTDPVSSKRIALTFDDGPDEVYTPRILDILKENQIKATFFVVGIQSAKYPQILKRIHEEGHAIGNHSWDHADLSKISLERIQQEIKDTDVLIEKTIGIKPTMVRAPYGAVSDKLKKLLAQSNRPLVGWSIDPRDWAGTSAAGILQNVKSHTKPGAIVLMHSFGGKNGNLDNTVEALPEMIAQLKLDGYQMVTVPQLNEAR